MIGHSCEGIIYVFEGMMGTAWTTMPDGQMVKDAAKAWHCSCPAFQQLLLDNPNDTDNIFSALSQTERYALYNYMATLGNKPGRIVGPMPQQNPPSNILALLPGQGEEAKKGALALPPGANLMQNRWAI